MTNLKSLNLNYEENNHTHFWDDFSFFLPNLSRNKKAQPPIAFSTNNSFDVR